MRTLVGTSGYAYKEWKGKFYPDDLAQNRWLEFYSGQFGTVEINNTFYRMPSSEVLRQWAAQVPDGFVFVIKASRRITHLGRLKNVADPVAFLFEKIGELGTKLGPVLFQLPPTMRKDLERLQSFLQLLPSGRKAAIEFRNETWFDDEVFAALRDRDVALCIADGELKTGSVPFVSTASWGYLRLRGVEYTDDQLSAWADRIGGTGWDESYVFFKHEDEATGPRLARRFIEIAGG